MSLAVSALLITCSTQATASNLNYCGSSTPKEARDLSQITKTLYGIVSGKAGSKRNWQLMEELMSPTAKIIPVFHNDEGYEIKELSVPDFIELNKQVFANVDFFETEVAAKIYQFGYSATIISQYESRDKVNAKPYSNGVNSFQLVNDGNRWCVISVTWDSDKGPYSKEDFILK